FTAMAEKIFKLIPGDIGRPVTDIALPLEIAALDKEVLEVFDSLTSKDMEVRDKQGRWWLMRIRPYKTTDHKIDGAVIVWLDIDAVKRGALNAEGARDFAEAIVNTVRGPLLVLDKDLVVKSANGAFYRVFKAGPHETIGRRIDELGGPQWNLQQLRGLLEDILKQNNSFSDFKVEHHFPGIGKKKMLLNGRRLVLNESEEMILLAIDVP